MAPASKPLADNLDGICKNHPHLLGIASPPSIMEMEAVALQPLANYSENVAI